MSAVSEHSQQLSKRTCSTYCLQRDQWTHARAIFFKEKPFFFDKPTPKLNWMYQATSTQKV